MSEALPVTAVVFDVGRVLFRWNLRHLYEGLIADPAQREWFVTHVVTEAWHFEHDAGRRLEELLAERKDEFPQYAALIDAYALRFADSIPGPVPGSLDLVEALWARGVPLYAITNFAAVFWPPFCASEPVFTRFRDIVVSGVEKLAKPDPAIFRLAAARFGHAAGEMLFIDDNAANIAAASEQGWQVHHFQDAGTLEDDLRGRCLI